MSRWKHVIDIRPALALYDRETGQGLTQSAHALANVLRTVPGVFEDESDYFEDFTDAMTADDFDVVLEVVYDLADAERVWCRG